jgi:hypothetical protein
MQTVEARKLTLDLRLVESADLQIGYELQKESKPELLVHLEELLLEVESELNRRNVQLQNRDLELIENINVINHLYSSYRYRVGRFLIKPIESIAIRLGLWPTSYVYTDQPVMRNVVRARNE